MQKLQKHVLIIRNNYSFLIKNEPGANKYPNMHKNLPGNAPPQSWSDSTAAVAPPSGTCLVAEARMVITHRSKNKAKEKQHNNHNEKR